MCDRLGLPGAVYTRTSCSDVVSWGSENHVNQMARLTDFELDVKEPQWTEAQFSSGETPENPQGFELYHE